MTNSNDIIADTCIQYNINLIPIFKGPSWLPFTTLPFVLNCLPVNITESRHIVDKAFGHVVVEGEVGADDGGQRQVGRTSEVDCGLILLICHRVWAVNNFFCRPGGIGTRKRILAGQWLAHYRVVWPVSTFRRIIFASDFLSVDSQVKICVLKEPKNRMFNSRSHTFFQFGKM